MTNCNQLINSNVVNDQNQSVQLGFSESPTCRLSVAHASPNWNEWDGGKIGGKPSWLNPRDVPTLSPLRCTACAIRSGSPNMGTILRFIAQIYSPADTETGNLAAYHRTLYVFACPHPLCSRHRKMNEMSEVDTMSYFSQSVIVLRCQLPKINDFYPLDCSVLQQPHWDKHLSKYWKIHLCIVCGQRASGHCPKSKQWVCGKDHQIESIKAQKELKWKQEKNNESSNLSFPSLYKESELVVEDEPQEDTLTELEMENIIQASMFPTNATVDRDEIHDDMDQKALNQITGVGERGVTDSTTLEFYTRIGRAQGSVKGQCLRYCRWPNRQCIYPNSNSEIEESIDDESNDSGCGPLWLSSQSRPNHEYIPCCQYCGSERRFEFQIMPQMLYFLLEKDRSSAGKLGSTDSAKDAFKVASDIIEDVTEHGLDNHIPADIKERHEELKEKLKVKLLGSDDDSSQDTMDWGVIVVYTCINSCGDGSSDAQSQFGSYRKEFAWRQAPLSYEN